MLDRDVLQCELSRDERMKLERIAGELGREPGDLAAELIGEALREAGLPATPSPDEGPEMHF